MQPIVIHGKFDFTVNYCDQTAVECHFLLSSSSFHSFNFFAPASSVLSSYKVIKESKYSWTSTYDHLPQEPLKSLYFWVVAKVLARTVSSRPMDTNFGKKYKENSLNLL